MYLVLRDESAQSAEPKLFEVNMIPHIYNGEESVLMIFQEADHLLQMDTLLRRSNHKSQILRDASHEFRTPLNCIISMLQLIQQDVDHFMNEIYVEPAMYSAEQLMSLVSDILDQAQVLTLTQDKGSREKQITRLLLSRSQG